MLYRMLPRGSGAVTGVDLVQGLGERYQRVNADIFLPSPPNCEIWGDGGGLTVFVNFNI